MRDFRLPEPVDLILCEFDALNHAPWKEDLALVGVAVVRALRPGGYFYFDVYNRLAFETIWPGTWWIEKPGLALVMHGGSERDTGWTKVEWFIRAMVAGDDIANTSSKSPGPAELDTKTGRVHGKTAARNTSLDFVEFLGEVVARADGIKRSISSSTISRRTRPKRFEIFWKPIRTCGCTSRRPTRPD